MSSYGWYEKTLWRSHNYQHVRIFINFLTKKNQYILFVCLQKNCSNFSLLGDDPGLSNQKTPTILLLTPSQQFHSFGFSARDFYHDLDQNEARRWYYFDKFKMILHHNKVQFTVIWFVKFQVRKCPFLLVFSKAYLGGRGSKNPKNVLTTRTVYEWSPINYSTLLIRNFKLENSKKGYWIQWTLTRSVKVENISEDSLDLIPSPSPLVKIQIIGGKVYLTW